MSEPFRVTVSDDEGVALQELQTFSDWEQVGPAGSTGNQVGSPSSAQPAGGAILWMQRLVSHTRE